MDDLPQPVRDQLAQIRTELDELETSHNWRASASHDGSRQLRSISSRIVLSSKRLEAYVKENTFSR